MPQIAQNPEASKAQSPVNVAPVQKGGVAFDLNSAGFSPAARTETNRDMRGSKGDLFNKPENSSFSAMSVSSPQVDRKVGGSAGPLSAETTVTQVTSVLESQTSVVSQSKPVETAIFPQVDEVMKLMENDRNITSEQLGRVEESLNKLADSDSTEIHQSARAVGKSTHELKEEMLDDIIRKLKQSSEAIQENHQNTCGIASAVDRKGFTENPDLVIGTAVDLITDGQAELNGQTIALNQQVLDLHPMEDGRSLFSAVVQESIAKHIAEEMTEGGRDYDVATSSYYVDVEINGEIQSLRHAGFYTTQLVEFDRLLTGNDSQNHFHRDYASPAEFSAAALSQMETIPSESIDSTKFVLDENGKITGAKGDLLAGVDTDTGGIVVMHALGTQGNHAHHFMTAYQFEHEGETFIALQNSIKGQETMVMSQREFTETLVSFMSDTDFNGKASKMTTEEIVVINVLSETPSTIEIDGQTVYAATSRPMDFAQLAVQNQKEELPVSNGYEDDRRAKRDDQELAHLKIKKEATFEPSEDKLSIADLATRFRLAEDKQSRRASLQQKAYAYANAMDLDEKRALNISEDEKPLDRGEILNTTGLNDPGY